MNRKKAVYKSRECIICKKYFLPTSPFQKTCEGECRVINRRAKERARDKKSRPLVKKQCPLCEKYFSTRDSKRIYCGSEVCEEARIKINSENSEKRRKGERVEEKRVYYGAHQEHERDRAQKMYRKGRSDAGVPVVKLYEPRGVSKHTIESARDIFAAEEYKLLETSFINSHSRLCVECPKGHLWATTLHNFKDNKNRCMYCYLASSGSSVPEKDIRQYLSVFGFDVLGNVRDVISPYELDIFLPTQKIAIEYCGLYWHGEGIGKDKKHLRQKMEMCNRQGIRLITLFEDEYLERREVVFSRISAALNLTEKRVYARSCDFEIISSSLASSFFNNNHLQGGCGSKIALGLFSNGELVQVMTLGALSRGHAGRGGKYIELKRLASSPGLSVVGGASKLFKRAKDWARNNGYTHIKSYCDMRWANPFKPVYEVLGFELANETKYTPHYFRGQKRYRNQSLRKTPEERLTGKTEWELRQEQGYDRIWDCGHRTYVYKL